MISDDDATVLRWSERGLLPTAGGPAHTLLTADSWLVHDEAVRGYDAHWARFGGWCEELGVPSDTLADFGAAVTSALPRTSRWFPRVELVPVPGGGGALQLRLRPAPPAAAREARVIVAPAGDPRTRPRRKGPDLDLLLALRSQAVDAGADELLLCDDDGRLVEGSLDSLLWWEDDALCTTPDELTLPGVTRGLLLSIAREQDIEVRVRSPAPQELAGAETWLTNALHGIRVISDWGPEPAAEAPRAELWRAALDRTARALHA